MLYGQNVKGEADPSDAGVQERRQFLAGREGADVLDGTFLPGAVEAFLYQKHGLFIDRNPEGGILTRSGQIVYVDRICEQGAVHTLFDES